MTEEQMRSELHKLCTESSRKAIAIEVGVSQAFISAVLKGRKQPGSKLLGRLGLRRKVERVTTITYHRT